MKRRSRAFLMARRGLLPALVVLVTLLTFHDDILQNGSESLPTLSLGSLLDERLYELPVAIPMTGGRYAHKVRITVNGDFSLAESIAPEQLQSVGDTMNTTVTCSTHGKTGTLTGTLTVIPESGNPRSFLLTADVVRRVPAHIELGRIEGPHHRTVSPPLTRLGLGSECKIISLEQGRYCYADLTSQADPNHAQLVIKTLDPPPGPLDDMVVVNVRDLSRRVIEKRFVRITGYVPPRFAPTLDTLSVAVENGSATAPIYVTFKTDDDVPVSVSGVRVDGLFIEGWRADTAEDGILSIYVPEEPLLAQQPSATRYWRGRLTVEGEAGGERVQSELPYECLTSP